MARPGKSVREHRHPGPEQSHAASSQPQVRTHSGHATRSLPGARRPRTVSGDGSLVTVGGLNTLLASYVSESQLAQSETNVQQNAAAIASTNAALASLDASTTASLAAKANASELANYASLSSLLAYGSQSDVATALASAAAGKNAEIETCDLQVEPSYSVFTTF